MSSDWQKAQMDAAQLPQPVRTAVERLIEVWDTMNHTPETRTQTLQVFNDLIEGRVLVETDKPDEIWVPCRLGTIVVRDTVRVKRDAYKPEKGAEIHNGRSGVVVAIRRGDIIIDYRDGIDPQYQGVRHPPTHLEKRVR